MISMPDRDTDLCISLSGRPSNIGTRFHNFLYRELGLNYLYKAFTTTDLPAAVAGIRALGIRGCGVSMPYKEDVIPLVDRIDQSAAVIDAVNTIVNDDGVLSAYNTDYVAVRSLLEPVDTGSRVLVRGSGGMAKAVVAALRDEGFTDVTVAARNAGTGLALADRYGFTWRPSGEGETADMLINVTPVGMSGGAEEHELAFTEQQIRDAQTVFDVVAMPVRTPLIDSAIAAERTVITGAQVVALQAAEQFALYTGVRPSHGLIARASEFSRA
ncbi:shikimate dehydrogenase [Hoyosella altamirensis]|uniref:Shikimate dehydrogenase n=2 Tax=Hoyosella altamirensis TaxID=616997 RepID=A0A839RMJ2_9ACTN|nr:shikimate dehydrogenase [Hoyosella altamirensis]